MIELLNLHNYNFQYVDFLYIKNHLTLCVIKDYGYIYIFFLSLYIKIMEKRINKKNTGIKTQVKNKINIKNVMRKTIPKKPVKCAKKLEVLPQELLETEEDLHINPLPTPAFVHFEASNTVTPISKFSPILNPRLHKKYQAEVNLYIIHKSSI